MNKEQQKLKQINEQIEKEIKKDYQNISLEKILNEYDPLIFNYYFNEDNKSLTEKINILINQLSDLIYNHTIYSEKIEKQSTKADDLWNNAIKTLIIFSTCSLFRFKILAIILAVFPPLSLTLSFYHNILSKIYYNQYNKENIQMVYLINLLKVATIELQCIENKEIEDVNNLSQCISGEEYKIDYSINENNLNIEVYNQENNEKVGVYKLNRHK